MCSKLKSPDGFHGLNGLGSDCLQSIIDDPDQYDRVEKHLTEFPKMMGFTMPFSTFLSAFSAPVAGDIRDTMGSYIPAFQLSLALLVVGLIFIVFARPPIHPSLKTAS